MKIVNLLYQSYPYVAGSTIRFHELYKNINSYNPNNIKFYNLVLPFYNTTQEKLYEQDYLKYEFMPGLLNKSSITKNIIYKIFFMPYFMFFIYQRIKTINPDVVHVHAMTYLILPVYILSLKFKYKIVFDVRSIWNINPDQNQKFIHHVFGLLDKVFLLLVNGCVYLSDSIKEYYKMNVFNIVLTNSSNRFFCDYNKTKPSFAYIGSLLENEGIDDTIKAFNKYVLDGGSCNLHVYGSGYFANVLKTLSSQNPRIVFHGKFDPKDKVKIYSRHSHIINFRKNTDLSNKVFPIKSIEAVLHSKFLIASNVKGIFNSIPIDLHDNCIFLNNVEQLSYYLNHAENNFDLNKYNHNAFRTFKKSAPYGILGKFKTLYKYYLRIC